MCFFYVNFPFGKKKKNFFFINCHRLRGRRRGGCLSSFQVSWAFRNRTTCTKRMYSNGFILISTEARQQTSVGIFPSIRAGKWTTSAVTGVSSLFSVHVPSKLHLRHALWHTMQTHHTHYPTNSFVLQRYCPSVAVRDRTEAVSPLMDTSRTRQYT